MTCPTPPAASRSTPVSPIPQTASEEQGRYERAPAVVKHAVTVPMSVEMALGLGLITEPQHRVCSGLSDPCPFPRFRLFGGTR